MTATAHPRPCPWCNRPCDYVPPDGRARKPAVWVCPVHKAWNNDTIWKYAPVHQGDKVPDAKELERALEAARFELKHTGAISFTEAGTGRRQVLWVLCGSSMGGGRFCTRRPHPADEPHHHGRE